MHFRLHFVVMVLLFVPLSLAQSNRCELLPSDAKLAIKQRFPTWRPKVLSDLVGYDKKLWLEMHPKECPGIAVGHVEAQISLRHAVLLIPQSGHARPASKSLHPGTFCSQSTQARLRGPNAQVQLPRGRQIQTSRLRARIISKRYRMLGTPSAPTSGQHNTAEISAWSIDARKARREYSPRHNARHSLLVAGQVPEHSMNVRLALVVRRLHRYRSRPRVPRE